LSFAVLLLRLMIIILLYSEGLCKDEPNEPHNMDFKHCFLYNHCIGRPE